VAEGTLELDDLVAAGAFLALGELPLCRFDALADLVAEIGELLL